MNEVEIVVNATDKTRPAFDSVRKSADTAVASMGKLSSASDTAFTATRKSADSAAGGFDKFGDAADSADTRAMGFRDTLTGVQDTMSGAAMLAKGPSFEAFLTLGAGIGDLGSGLYNFLVPALKSAVKGMRGVTTAAVESAGSTKGMRAELGSTADAASRTSGATQKMRGELNATAGAATKTGSAMRSVGKAVGIGLPIVGAAVAVWQVLKSQQEAHRQVVDDLTEAIVADSGALGDNTRAAVVNHLEKSGALKAAKEAGLSTADYTDAVMGNAEAQRVLLEVLRSGKDDEGRIIAGYKNEKEALGESTEAAARKAEANKTAAATAVDLTTVTAAETVEFKDLKSAIDAVTEEVSDMLEAQLALKGASIGYKDAVVALDESIHDNGKTLDDNSVKGRANEKSLLSVVEAADRQRQAQITSGVAVGKANEAYNKQIAALREHAIKSGLSRGEVDRLLTSINHLPTTRELKIMADAKHARDVIDATRKYYAGLSFPAKTVSIVVSQNGTVQRVQREIDSISGHVVAIQVGSVRGNGPRGQAHGGIVGAATGGLQSDLVQVGEHGPELLDLPPGSRVLSNPDSMRHMAAAGGGPQVVLQVLPGGGALDRMFVEWLRKSIRDGAGGNVQTYLGN